MSSKGGPTRRGAKGRKRNQSGRKQQNEAHVLSDRGRSMSKRTLNHPRREESRRFKNGNAYSKKTLQEVFNRACAEESGQPYREEDSLSNTDIIKINAAIRHEMYDAKGLEVGWLTFTELQKRFPHFLRHLRKEIEKKYEVLQKCVAQWGVDWAIQRVLQRDRNYQPRSIKRSKEEKQREKKADIIDGRNRTNREDNGSDDDSEDRGVIRKNSMETDTGDQAPELGHVGKAGTVRCEETANEFPGSHVQKHSNQDDREDAQSFEEDNQPDHSDEDYITCDHSNDKYVQSGHSDEKEIQTDDSDEEEIQPQHTVQPKRSYHHKLRPSRDYDNHQTLKTRRRSYTDKHRLASRGRNSSVRKVSRTNRRDSRRTWQPDRNNNPTLDDGDSRNENQEGFRGKRRNPHAKKRRRKDISEDERNIRRYEISECAARDSDVSCEI